MRPLLIVSIIVVAALGSVLAAGSRTAVLWLARPLVRVEALRPVDAIVVLGGGAYGDATLTAGTAYRLVYGVTLLHTGYAPLLVLSGGPHKGTNVSDAEAMAIVARNLGVKPAAILLDPRSSSTVAQARSVAELASRYGIGSIALVTSPLKSYRAARAFRVAGLQVVAAPGISRREDVPTALFVAEDHLLHRLGIGLDALYEYIAIALYWARGWL